MARWVKAAEAAECPAGQGLELVVEDRIVALFNVDGVFHALDGVCPHQGGPLGQGKLVGCVVTCPWHGWQFDVRDGQHQFSPTVVHTGFPTRVEGSTVLVDLDG